MYLSIIPNYLLILKSQIVGLSVGLGLAFGQLFAHKNVVEANIIMCIKVKLVKMATIEEYTTT